MNLAPDTTPVRNPERTKALSLLRQNQQTVAELEQRIGQHLTTTATTLALTGYRRERGGSCVSYVGTSEGAGSRRWAAVAASVR